MSEVKNVLQFLLQILLQHQLARACHWNGTNCCKGYCVFWFPGIHFVK
jgi:hypothetical protein